MCYQFFHFKKSIIIMKKAVYKLVAGSLVSKLLGFLRETLLATWFGTSEVAAAYRIAHSVVFTFINAVVGDTLTSGLVPLYQKNRNASEPLASGILLIALGATLLIGLVLGALAFLFAPQVVNLFAPGINDKAETLAISLLRVMSAAIPIIMLGNIIAYIEAAHERYMALSSRATLTNIGIIMAAGGAAFFNAPVVLAAGYVAVYTLFMLWALSDLFRYGHIRTLLLARKSDTGVARKLLWANTCALLGLPIVTQVVGFVERIVASWIDTSAIPAMDYARFLTETIVSLSAVPLGIAMLTKMNAIEWDDIRKDAAKYSNLLLVLFMPVGLFLFSCSEDIIRLVYMRGAFDEHSVMMTSAVFQGLALALGFIIPAYFLQKTLNKAMRNRQLVISVLIAASANLAFILLLWREFGPLAIGYGNCIFGTVLYAGTVTILKIWRDVLPVLIWVVLAAAGACVVFSQFPMFDFWVVEVIAKGITTTLIFGTIYLMSKETRSVGMSILAIMKIKCYKK